MLGLEGGPGGLLMLVLGVSVGPPPNGWFTGLRKRGVCRPRSVLEVLGAQSVVFASDFRVEVLGDSCRWGERSWGQRSTFWFMGLEEGVWEVGWVRVGDRMHIEPAKKGLIDQVGGSCKHRTCWEGQLLVTAWCLLLFNMRTFCLYRMCFQ